MIIHIAGEELHLLAERAVFWPRESMLLVADVHFGKAAAFRAASIPVPRGTTTSDLARLDALLLTTRARRLTVLGDVLHAREGRHPETMAAVALWRERHRSAEMILVRGNHDRGAGDPPAAFGMECVNSLAIPPFHMVHDVRSGGGGYTLSGHTHPAVEVRGRGRQKARLPCFVFGEHGGVLPAFGSFTGSHGIEPAPGERVFAVAGSEIMEIA